MHDGTIYFSNYADQRVYRLVPGTEPQPITPAEKLRYADGVVDERRNRMICVREDRACGWERSGEHVGQLQT